MEEEYRKREKLMKSLRKSNMMPIDQFIKKRKEMAGKSLPPVQTHRGLTQSATIAADPSTDRLKAAIYS